MIGRQVVRRPTVAYHCIGFRQSELEEICSGIQISYILPDLQGQRREICDQLKECMPVLAQGWGTSLCYETGGLKLQNFKCSINKFILQKEGSFRLTVT